MIDYTPDRWLVVKITTNDETLYKVFASWYGGYAGSDSWKMNSGITEVISTDDYYDFHGWSGSVYRCYKNCYGANTYGNQVFKTLLTRQITKLKYCPKIQIGKN